MDKEKFDEMTLAMLWYNHHAAGSAWKGLDWESTDRLFRAGLISDPKSKRKSVVFSEAGAKQGEAAFRRHFGEPG